MSAPVDMSKAVHAAVAELNCWQRDHGEDRRSLEAIATLQAAEAATTKLLNAAKDLTAGMPAGWRLEVVEFNPAGVTYFSSTRREALHRLQEALAGLGGAA